MSEAEDPDKTRQLAQVAGLAMSVADRIIIAQITGLQIPHQQITALVRAARLLKDEAAEWPSLVEQALQELADGMTVEDEIEIISESA